MSESRWNIKLDPLFGVHLDSDPLAKSIRLGAKIHSYVEDFTPHNTHQFTLGFGTQLEMKTPQYPMIGTDEIVLDEFTVNCREGTPSIRLCEVPSFIYVTGRLDQDNVGNFKRCKIESQE